MATKNRPVSLVVVPRYLEADPGLEEALRERRTPVTGGVVLGQAEIMPEDTRALLRQVLAAAGRSGVLGAVQGVLGSLEGLLVAILALFSVGAASQGVREFEHRLDEGEFVMPFRGKQKDGPPHVASDESTRTDESTPLPTTLIAGMAGFEVTVWLRSGKKLVGTVDDQEETAPFFQLRRATIQHPDLERNDVMTMVRVPVNEIELIGQNNSSADKTKKQAEVKSPSLHIGRRTKSTS
jgi:hypothetical protein